MVLCRQDDGRLVFQPFGGSPRVSESDLALDRLTPLSPLRVTGSPAALLQRPRERSRSGSPLPQSRSVSAGGRESRRAAWNGSSVSICSSSEDAASRWGEEDRRNAAERRQAEERRSLEVDKGFLAEEMRRLAEEKRRMGEERNFLPEVGAGVGADKNAFLLDASEFRPFEGAYKLLQDKVVNAETRFGAEERLIAEERFTLDDDRLRLEAGRAGSEKERQRIVAERAALASEAALLEGRTREVQEGLARIDGEACCIVEERTTLARSMAGFEKERQFFEASKLAFDEERRLLEERARAVDTERSRLEDRARELQESLARVAEETRDAAEERANLEAGLSGLEKEVIRLKEGRAALDDERARIADEARRVAEERTRLHAQMREVEVARRRMDDESRLLAEERTRLDAQMRELEEARRRLDDESRLLAEERTRLDFQMRELEEIRRRIDDESRVLADERGSLEMQREALALQATRMREEQVVLEEGHESLRIQVVANGDKSRAPQSAGAELAIVDTEEVISLRRERSLWDSEREKLMSEVARLGQEKGALEKERDVLTVETAHHRETIMVLEKGGARTVPAEEVGRVLIEDNRVYNGSSQPAEYHTVCQPSSTSPTFADNFTVDQVLPACYAAAPAMAEAAGFASAPVCYAAAPAMAEAAGFASAPLCYAAAPAMAEAAGFASAPLVDLPAFEELVRLETERMEQRTRELAEGQERLKDDRRSLAENARRLSEERKALATERASGGGAPLSEALAQERAHLEEDRRELMEGLERLENEHKRTLAAQLALDEERTRYSEIESMAALLEAERERLAEEAQQLAKLRTDLDEERHAVALDARKLQEGLSDVKHAGFSETQHEKPPSSYCSQPPSSYRSQRPPNPREVSSPLVPGSPAASSQGGRAPQSSGRRSPAPGDRREGSVVSSYGCAPACEAERWVEAYEAQPVVKTTSVVYPNGVRVDFPMYSDTLASVGRRNAQSRMRTIRAIEDGEIMRLALMTFRACDCEMKGYLSWASGEISSYISAIFRQRGLESPTQSDMRQLYLNLDVKRNKRLNADECLYLTDALFRAAFQKEIVPFEPRMLERRRRCAQTPGRPSRETSRDRGVEERSGGQYGQRPHSVSRSGSPDSSPALGVLIGSQTYSVLPPANPNSTDLGYDMWGRAVVIPEGWQVLSTDSPECSAIVAELASYCWGTHFLCVANQEGGFDAYRTPLFSDAHGAGSKCIEEKAWLTQEGERSLRFSSRGISRRVIICTCMRDPADPGEGLIEELER